MTAFLYMLTGLAAVLAAMLGGAAVFTRLPTRQSLFFGLLNLGTFVWAGSYFLGYTAPVWAAPPDREAAGTAVFLLAQFGIGAVSTYWFAFSAETTGHGGWARGRRLALAHVPAVVLVTAALTNGWHGLFVTEVSGRVPVVTYGPLGILTLLANYALVAATIVMYVKVARGANSQARGTSLMLAAGAAAVLVTNVVWTTRHLTGIDMPYNPTILVLPVVNIVIVLLVMRTDLLDIVPVAEGQAFHGMADAGIVLTPGGRVLAVNDAARFMVPQVQRGHLLAEDAPDLAADVERLSAGYTDQPHGEQAWWLRVVPMRSVGGRSLGRLVLLTDLAEKRAFEQRIVELNRDLRRTVLELETATRAKDRFIANASHELRTPLQSVIGYTQRLLFERVGPLKKAQRDELEIVERSAHHLLAVIESLLDIAHLQSGGMEVERVPFDPSVTAREVIDAVRPLAEAKSLRVTLSCGDMPVLVGDETKLRQILLNLLANAAKFTEVGGIMLDCRREGEAAVFRVSDTGPGIPAEELERIFEAFHRVRAGGNETSGSGLGLHVSQILAEMLGATLDVDSTPGTGTTFTLRLPAPAWESVV